MRTATITITEREDGGIDISGTFEPDGMDRESYAHGLACVAMKAMNDFGAAQGEDELDD